MIDERDFLERNEEEGWQIEDDQQAEWAICKVKEAQADFEKWKTYYESMTEKAKDKTEHTVAYMTKKLREYFRQVPHKETKTTEKYSLPSGDLVLRKPKSVWEHNDDEALLEWTKKNGFTDCIKVTEKVNWAELKKRFAENSDGVVYDTETGLVCDAVESKLSKPEFVLSMNK